MGVRCRWFTRSRQRFKQNAAHACLVKKKTGFTIHGPRLLPRLQRRVDRSSFPLFLLQLCYNTVNNDAPCRNTEEGFNQLFPFSFFFCTMSPLSCNVNSGDMVFPFSFSFFFCIISTLFIFIDVFLFIYLFS